MSKKIDKELQEMRAALTKVLNKWVSHEYKDENGNEMPPPNHVLSNAIKHLKDNHAELTPADAKTIEELDALAASLPFGSENQTVN